MKLPTNWRLLILTFALLSTTSLGQGQYFPPHSGTILYAGWYSHQVWALNDLDFDGTTEQAGEAVLWYTAANGPQPDFIADMDPGPDGAVYLADGSFTAPKIIRLLNLNLDADCDDPGEATIFFDQSNAEGIVLGRLGSMTVLETPQTAMYVMGDGWGPQLLYLEDLNGDGDALDPGESSVVWTELISNAYFNPIMSSPNMISYDDAGQLRLHSGHAVSDPNDPTGIGFYYPIVDLQDLNGDGDYHDAGEVTELIYDPLGGKAIPFGPNEFIVGESVFLYRLGVNWAVIYAQLAPIGTSPDVRALYPFVNENGVRSLLVAFEPIANEGQVLLVEEVAGTQWGTQVHSIHDSRNIGAAALGRASAICCLPAPSLSGPTNVAIGQTYTATHRGIRGHTFWSGYSFASTPISVPPFGEYWLGTYPPLGYSVAEWGVVPNSGHYDISFTVPNLAWLSGSTIDCQSFEYDGFYGRLSQRYRFTVQ